MKPQSLQPWEAAGYALEAERLPRHVAIVMDGNGRWATRRGLPRAAGHRSGAMAVRRVVEAAVELGVPYLTLYAFSSENWKRPESEVNLLMSLLVEYLHSELRTLTQNGVRLATIGRVDGLPAAARVALLEAVQRTKDHDRCQLTLALNYGGRQEILDAVREALKLVQDGAPPPDEATFSQLLQTRGMPDPDLIIRTSGEKRLSNFMLWQASYSELYWTETLWPDFDQRDFWAALADYQSRQRRYGGLT